ncbi:unnamed protein product [Amoebophrya sp. A120]|nr:unnamed protein product [Amoebophrya sp. A120]|eukprot:GSA120T00010875001.1
MDLHEAHVKLEQLDFRGISVLVQNLQRSANLHSSSKVRVAKRLKRCLHLLLNEEPSVRGVLLASSVRESKQENDHTAEQQPEPHVATSSPVKEKPLALAGAESPVVLDHVQLPDSTTNTKHEPEQDETPTSGALLQHFSPPGRAGKGEQNFVAPPGIVKVVDSAPAVDVDLQIPVVPLFSSSTSSSSEGVATTGEHGAVVQINMPPAPAPAFVGVENDEDEDQEPKSVLDVFDLWEPILNFAVEWPRGWGKLSCVCRKWRKLLNSPVAWEGHHVQLAKRDIVGIWPPICHLAAVWASAKSIRLPDRLAAESEDILLRGFERKEVVPLTRVKAARRAARAKRRKLQEKEQQLAAAAMGEASSAVALASTTAGVEDRAPGAAILGTDDHPDPPQQQPSKIMTSVDIMIRTETSASNTAELPGTTTRQTITSGTSAQLQHQHVGPALLPGTSTTSRPTPVQLPPLGHYKDNLTNNESIFQWDSSVYLEDNSRPPSPSNLLLPGGGRRGGQLSHLLLQEDDKDEPLSDESGVTGPRAGDDRQYPNGAPAGAESNLSSSYRDNELVFELHALRQIFEHRLNAQSNPKDQTTSLEKTASRRPRRRSSLYLEGDVMSDAEQMLERDDFASTFGSGLDTSFTKTQLSFPKLQEVFDHVVLDYLCIDASTLAYDTSGLMSLELGNLSGRGSSTVAGGSFLTAGDFLSHNAQQERQRIPSDRPPLTARVLTVHSCEMQAMDDAAGTPQHGSSASRTPAHTNHLQQQAPTTSSTGNILLHVGAPSLNTGEGTPAVSEMKHTEQPEQQTTTFSSLLFQKMMAASEQPDQRARLLLPIELRNQLPLLTGSWYDFKNHEQSVDVPSPRRCTALRTPESSKGFGVLVGAQCLRRRLQAEVRYGTNWAVAGANEAGEEAALASSHSDHQGATTKTRKVKPFQVAFAEFRRFRLFLEHWSDGCRLDIGVTQVAPQEQRTKIRFAEDLLGCWIVEATGLLVGSHPGVRLRSPSWNAGFLRQGDVLECRIYKESGDLELWVNGVRRGVWQAKIRKSPHLYPVVDLFEHQGERLRVVLLQE